MSQAQCSIPGPVLLACGFKDDYLLMRDACSRAELAMPICPVYSGVQALDYLLGNGPYGDRSRHPFPSLLLADARLPVLSGLEMLKQIRATPTLPFLPVILMVDPCTPRDLDQARELGANSILLKPFTLHHLKTTLKSFADFWLTACRLPTVGPHTPPGHRAVPARGS